MKRDGRPWQCIATLRLPADAPHKTLKSVEPVNGGRGAFGRSYFTVQAGHDEEPDNSIWLFGSGSKGDHLIRRLDDGAVTGKAARRLDPGSYIGERELFVYYNLVGEGPSQLHRCRTGIRSSCTATPVHAQPSASKSSSSSARTVRYSRFAKRLFHIRGWSVHSHEAGYGRRDAGRADRPIELAGTNACTQK